MTTPNKSNSLRQLKALLIPCCTFGARGPTRNVAYAMFRGRNPNVFRIHADVREEARKDVYALRNKTVFDIESLKMMRFEIERRGTERVVIEHDKGKWTMLEPTTGEAKNWIRSWSRCMK